MNNSRPKRNRIIDFFLRAGRSSGKAQSDTGYLLTVLGIEKESDIPAFCLSGASLIKELQEKRDAIFQVRENRVLVTINRINYLVNSWEELLILNEVFVKGIYNFNTYNEFVFVDIGMNAGITSLYFADKKLCTKVIAFEPFEKTISFATTNFQLNKFSDKIHLHRYGLGYPARTISVQYSEEYKGSVGINGVASYIATATGKEAADMKIVDVWEAFSHFIEQEKNIIVKMDCEGAEYEIMERLDNTGLVGKVNCFMIEWHLRGPADLIAIFLKNSYTVISLDQHSTDIGMLYAFKNSGV